MSHMRKQIRDAIVTRLQGITGFADVVYPYRTAPHTVLPDIVVAIVEDEVNHDYDTKGSARMHELTVDIEIRDKATDYLDDTLDGICVSVEKAMMTDAKFGGLVYHLELEGTSIELEEEIGRAHV